MKIMRVRKGKNLCASFGSKKIVLKMKKVYLLEEKIFENEKKKCLNWKKKISRMRKGRSLSTFCFWKKILRMRKMIFFGLKRNFWGRGMSENLTSIL